MNNIQFSLSEHFREKLAEHSQGESLGKTAKRLIMEILDGKNSGSVPSSSDLGDLGDLGDRLSDLERRANISDQIIEPLDQKYSELLDKLSLWEALQRQVSQLEKRLDSIPTTETAILVEKKPRGRRPKVAINE